MNIWSFLLLVGLIHVTCSRGYRGGNTAPSSSNKYRATNLRTWSVDQKTKPLFLNTVYISSRMRVRYGSPEYFKDHDVTICRNATKYPEYNGTISIYGWFVCPLEKEVNSHCCGSDGNEHCCDFWSSTGAIGAYIGFAVLGIGIIVGLVFLAIYLLKPSLLCRPRQIHAQVGDSTVAYNGQPVTVVTVNNTNPPNYGPTYGNPVGPYTNKDDLYPPQQYGVYSQSPPPSYDAKGNAPSE